jgi:hypothetical protein
VEYSGGRQNEHPRLEKQSGGTNNRSLKAAQVRLPAEVLPPPLNRNSIPPDYLACVAQAEPGGPDLIIAALWGHYKRETPGWMGQAALLPSW